MAATVRDLPQYDVFDRVYGVFLFLKVLLCSRLTVSLTLLVHI